MPKPYRVYDDPTIRDLDRQCKGKQRYDKKGAIMAAKRAHKRGRVKEARVYLCGDHWHIARRQPIDKRFRD